WHIGFPIHWGYAAAAQHKGPLANILTASVFDPNVWTPEFKVFQVRLEKAGSGKPPPQGSPDRVASKA
ncbi:MAG TPA: hypothetical protein VK454_06905, partial [Myxococcaceae bacterium]|nr:hypothetical protein [Myxococcaceae bacterium]